jgi:hypothetical protein
MSNEERKLRVGDWVEVRSEAEILKTPDRHGQANIPRQSRGR